jgi:hypothetical protein
MGHNIILYQKSLEYLEPQRYLCTSTIVTEGLINNRQPRKKPHKIAFCQHPHALPSKITMHRCVLLILITRVTLQLVHKICSHFDRAPVLKCFRSFLQKRLKVQFGVDCRQDFYMPFQFYFLTPFLVLFVTRDISTVINNGAVFGHTVADVCS